MLPLKLDSYNKFVKALNENKEKQLVSLILEVNSTNEDKITKEEVEELLEHLNGQDPEVIEEFFGKLAGMLGGGLSHLGKKLGNYHKKSERIKAKNSAKKAVRQGKLDTRRAHSDAIKAYGKTLKGGDLKARKTAFANMKAAQQKSLASRGITLTGKKQSSGKKTRTLSTSQSKGDVKKYKKVFNIKDWIEIVGKILNEKRD